jgi:cobalt-zinc-cadmium efflux system outer membrane protein
MGNRNGSGGTQGPIIGQTIVTAHKLKLARAAAEAGLVAADWQAMTRWFEVMTRVRQAYFEVLTARAEVQANEEVVKLAEDGLSAVRKLHKAELATQPDLLRAEVELEQSQVRLRSAQQRARAAWKLLATAVGVPDLPLARLKGTLDGKVPEYEWEPVVGTVLTKSSELQEAEALVGQNERLLTRAVAERVPDLKVSVRPFYSYIDHDSEVKFEAGAALPLFNRNQGNIAAARADLERSQHELRQVELRLTDRLTAAFQRYRDAKQQVEAYQKKIVPHALESLKLVRKGYDKQDPRYDYTAVLQSQQILAQARLAYVQALGSLWRAAVDIAGLLQEK